MVPDNGSFSLFTPIRFLTELCVIVPAVLICKFFSKWASLLSFANNLDLCGPVTGHPCPGSPPFSPPPPFVPPPPISAPGKLPSVAIALSYKADLQSSWWGLFQLFIMDVAIVADHNSLYTLTCVAELFYSCHGSEYCVFLLVVFKIPSRSLGKFLLFHGSKATLFCPILLGQNL